MIKNIKPIVLILFLGLSVSFFAGNVLAEEEIVSLNKASLEQIQVLFEELDLPPELAQALVTYRKANGDFKTPEEVVNVPGMTQDFIEELNPQDMDGDIVYDPDAEPALAPSKC